MTILGIETSCDETATAIVENGRKILSNVVASSVEMHAKTGGIIPEVAAREQAHCIIPVIEEAIQQSNNIAINNIDAIAVTVGPGLIGSLLVGVETAKALAYAWNKPIIPVNHLIAHIYANWIENKKTEDGKQKTDSRKLKTENRNSSSLSSVINLQSSSLGLQPSVFSIPTFPLIVLVVSGGHTDLVLMKNHGEIKWIGGTRDDAAGECFDKCARLLGLGYPGGPAVAASAAQYEISNMQYGVRLPRPMINDKNFDFSFSGLKTAVLREVAQLRSNQQYNNLAIQQLSFEIQEAIVDVLVAKTLRTAEKFKVKSILLAGGVAANQRLREKFSSHPVIQSSKCRLFVPTPQLCTDNAAVIASAAYFNYKPIPWVKITADPGLHFKISRG